MDAMKLRPAMNTGLPPPRGAVPPSRSRCASKLLFASVRYAEPKLWSVNGAATSAPLPLKVSVSPTKSAATPTR